jgi:hypothetical protein
MLELIAALGFLWWLVILVVAFVFAGLMPFLAWSAVRSLTGIRRELAVLNDTLARLDRTVADAGVARTAAEEIATPGQRFRVRTGPLDIR